MFAGRLPGEISRDTFRLFFGFKKRNRRGQKAAVDTMTQRPSPPGNEIESNKRLQKRGVCISRTPGTANFVLCLKNLIDTQYDGCLVVRRALGRKAADYNRVPFFLQTKPL